MRHKHWIRHALYVGWPMGVTLAVMLGSIIHVHQVHLDYEQALVTHSAKELSELDHLQVISERKVHHEQ
jgi:hypothetical protein